MDDNRNGIIY